MQLHVARMLIRHNPHREKAIIGYDRDDRPIVRSVSTRIASGEVFTPADEEELAFFLSLDAVRPLTDDEKYLFEMGVQTIFPTAKPDLVKSRQGQQCCFAATLASLHSGATAKPSFARRACRPRGRGNLRIARQGRAPGFR